MAYLSLYRKWRPQRFEDVVGQEHVVRTVANALRYGRAAHAYLFCGPRGTGKTTLARLLAKGLNCQQGGPTPEPCNECESCRRIADGSSLDVIEIDGASNRGIDEIRELREKARFAPAQSRFKVYIIDEVHMLTNEAFNALLKLLEEPPAHVVFVFATTDPQKIPATILSRCQRFDFRRLSAAEIAGHLQNVARQEGIAARPEALALIARHAEGGMRDALAVLDQCIAYQEGELTPRVVEEVLGVARPELLRGFVEAIVDRSPDRALLLVGTLTDEGKDLRQFVRDLIGYCRELMLAAARQGGGRQGQGHGGAGPGRQLLLGDPGVAGSGGPEGQELGAEGAAALEELAARVPVAAVVRWIEVLSEAEQEMRYAPSPRIPLEVAAVRLTRVDADPTAAALAAQLQELFQRLSRLEQAAEAQADGPSTSATPAIPSTPATRATPKTPAPPAPSPSTPAVPLPEPADEIFPGKGPARPAQAAAAAAPAAASKLTSAPASPAPPAPSGPPAASTATAAETAATAPAAGAREAPAPPAVAPAAAATAAPAAKAPPSTTTLQRVQQVWPRLLQVLQSQRLSVQRALLAEGRPVGVEGSSIVVAFRWAFHRENLVRDARGLAAVEKHLISLLGQQVQLSLEVIRRPAAGGAPPDPANPPGSRQAPSSGPAAAQVAPRPQGAPAPSAPPVTPAPQPPVAQGSSPNARDPGVEAGEQRGSPGAREAEAAIDGIPLAGARPEEEEFLRAALRLFRARLVKVENLAQGEGGERPEP